MTQSVPSQRTRPRMPRVGLLLVAYVLLHDASVVNTRAEQQTVQGTEDWISCRTHDECGEMEEEPHFCASALNERNV